ncbi:AAA family ATPase [Candidatus Bathyarchaeota archaeon]|nr:AAA family ATPase [Candidatus Bathyarchaeota archaeon]
MAENVYQLAKNAATQAIQYDNKGEYQLAIQHYTRAVDLLLALIKYSESSQIASYYKQTARQYINRANQLKTSKPARRRSRDSPEPLRSEPEAADDFTDDLLLDISGVKWEDIAGLQDAKNAIYQALIIPMKRKELFVGRATWRAMLLHGPPGCGKTMLAIAAAAECDMPVYGLSAADIMDKYVGESEKRIRALFEAARRNQPAIVFIDEFDALAPGESAQNAAVQDRIMAEVAAQLDGVRKDTETRILFWGATNTPWKLAPRTIRRFDKRIHVPLPDLDARKAIFNLNVLGEPKIDTTEEVDLAELAALTEGYSGDDIKKMSMDAWYIPIQELIDDGTIDYAMPRKVSRQDFLTAITKRKSTVTAEVAQRYYSWAKEFDSI